MNRLEIKLKKLPKTPGVYFHKNSKGEIIYIGKAANLRNRVRQYFQLSRSRDAKTDSLVSEIADVDWTEVETEIDALFLEAELVRRYLPKFNILLRDDKSLSYVRIDYKSDYPTVSMVRRPLDDNANYFGPYLNSFEVKKALRLLRKIFPYATSKQPNQKRASLHYHLGLDPGLEEGKTTLPEYRGNLRILMEYLRGNRTKITKQIENEMKYAADKNDFESAAKLRNKLFALNSLARQIKFSDREIQDASRDLALVELGKILQLQSAPKRIEGFDISHIQGSDTVASMVVFESGVPAKAEYRKFKMRVPGNDDFAHMFEAISRRFSKRNSSRWKMPNLVLIDGGKGQLTSAISARDSTEHINIPMIGIAKQEERIIISTEELSLAHTDKIKKICDELRAYVDESDKFLSILLPKNSHALKLLQRIRDESHRFAVTYHSTLRTKRQKSSYLDQISGVGPATRKKLIRHFGSLVAIKTAKASEIEEVVGKAMAEKIIKYL